VPQTPVRELTAVPDPIAGFLGSTSKGRDGREGQGRGKGEGRVGKDAKKRGGERREVERK